MKLLIVKLNGDKWSILVLGILLNMFVPRLANTANSTNSDTPLQPIVVLVRLADCCAQSAWQAAEERIKRELSLENLPIAVVDGPKQADRHVKDILGRAIAHTAAKGSFLLFVAPDGQVELHTLYHHPDTGRDEYNQLVMGNSPTDDTVEIVAIKTKEAVQATLYEREDDLINKFVLPATPTPGAQIIPPPTSQPTLPPTSQSMETPVSSSSSPSLSSPVSRQSASKKETRKTPEQAPETTSGISQKQKQEPTSLEKVTPKANKNHLLQVHTNLGPLWSPGGVGAMGFVGGGISFSLPKKIIVGAEVWTSVLNKKIQSNTAQASVQLTTARFRAAYTFSQKGPMIPILGVRVGIGHVRSKGKSDTNLVKTAHTTLFYGGVLGEIQFVLTNRFSIPVSFGLGLLPPGVSVRFAGEDQAHLRVLMETGIGLALAL